MGQNSSSASRASFDQLPSEAFIRLFTLVALGLIPFSTSTLWRRCRSGNFPPPIRVSNQITAWRVGEIREWLADPQSYKAKV